MDTQISEFITKLRSNAEAHEYSCDTTSSSVHRVDAVVPTGLFHDLETMSAVYKREISCLAGDLMTIALREAIASLPDSEKEHLKSVRETTDKETMSQFMERVKYDAGAS